MADANDSAAMPDGYVLAPIILRPLAVSEIKDAMESEFNFHIDQARPLWARLLEIATGIPLDEQERIHADARLRAPAPLSGWQARAKLTDALNGWRVYEAGGYQLVAHHPDVGEVRGDSRGRAGVYSVIALLKVVLDAMLSAAPQPAAVEQGEPKPAEGGAMADMLRRALPYLRDEGAKYDDDGGNEPLELAREIEAALETEKRCG